MSHALMAVRRGRRNVVRLRLRRPIPENPNISLPFAALVTRLGEKCGLGGCRESTARHLSGATKTLFLLHSHPAEPLILGNIRFEYGQAEKELDKPALRFYILFRGRSLRRN